MKCKFISTRFLDVMTWTWICDDEVGPFTDRVQNNHQFTFIIMKSFARSWCVLKAGNPFQYNFPATYWDADEYHHMLARISRLLLFSQHHKRPALFSTCHHFHASYHRPIASCAAITSQFFCSMSPLPPTLLSWYDDHVGNSFLFTSLLLSIIY